MIGTSRAGRHALAATTMFVGSALVFGFVVLMNEYSKPPPPERPPESTEFKVEKKKKPPPRPKPRPKPQRPQRFSQNRAPVPQLATSISEVALEVPGFDSSELGEISDEVLGETSKQMVMDEGSVDEPPRPLSRVPPDEYPRKARKEGIEGFVTMSLLIGTTGEIERIKVLEAKPPGVFDEVALTTIRKWRFAPATYQAEQVRVWAKQTIRFQLD